MKLLVNFSKVSRDVATFLDENPKYIDHVCSTGFPTLETIAKHPPGIYEAEEYNYYWDGVTALVRSRTKKGKVSVMARRTLYVLTLEGEQALKEMILEKAFV